MRISILRVRDNELYPFQNQGVVPVSTLSDLEEVSKQSGEI
jgi:hypothetical protein